MMNAKYLCYGIIVLILQSCVKEETVFNHKIQGVYYKDCDKVPIENAQISLVKINNYAISGGSNRNVLASTHTDHLGRFSFNYEVKNKVDLSIDVNNGYATLVILEKIPVGDHLNLEVYLTTQVNLSLDVTFKNQYTETDTFIISIDGAKIQKFPGPFDSKLNVRGDDLIVQNPRFNSPNNSARYALVRKNESFEFESQGIPDDEIQYHGFCNDATASIVIE